MNIQQFFLTYLILIFTGSFFIMGFYIITRPDKILGTWSKFWEKIIRVDRFYYSGEALLLKYYYLNHVCKQVGMKIEAGVTIHDTIALKIKNGVSFTEDDKFSIRDFLFCETEVVENEIRFYVNEERYRFPEIIHKPLSSCPPCMASIFGSVFWWSVVYFQRNAFFWAANQKICYFVYWIFFCISLAFINYFIAKKLNL